MDHQGPGFENELVWDGSDLARSISRVDFDQAHKHKRLSHQLKQVWWRMERNWILIMQSPKQRFLQARDYSNLSRNMSIYI